MPGVAIAVNTVAFVAYSTQRRPNSQSKFVETVEQLMDSLANKLLNRMKRVEQQRQSQQWKEHASRVLLDQESQGRLPTRYKKAIRSLKRKVAEGVTSYNTLEIEAFRLLEEYHAKA
jgi:uncharacterized protein YdaL